MEKGPTENKLQHFACTPTPRQPTGVRMGSHGTQRMLSGSLVASKPRAGQPSAHVGLGAHHTLLPELGKSWRSCS